MLKKKTRNHQTWSPSSSPKDKNGENAIKKKNGEDRKILNFCCYEVAVDLICCVAKLSHQNSKQNSKQHWPSDPSASWWSHRSPLSTHDSRLWIFGRSCQCVEHPKLDHLRVTDSSLFRKIIQYQGYLHVISWNFSAHASVLSRLGPKQCVAVPQILRASSPKKILDLKDLLVQHQNPHLLRPDRAQRYSQSSLPVAGNARCTLSKGGQRLKIGDERNSTNCLRWKKTL